MQPDPADDEVTATVEPELSLLTVTEHGFGKRTLVDEYRVQPESGPMRSQSRGGKGRADIKTTSRNGPSVAACIVADTDDVVVISRKGQLVRMAASDISQIGRGTQGVKVVGLNDGDSVVAVARVADTGDSEDEATPEDSAE